MMKHKHLQQYTYAWDKFLCNSVGRACMQTSTDLFNIRTPQKYTDGTTFFLTSLTFLQLRGSGGRHRQCFPSSLGRVLTWGRTGAKQVWLVSQGLDSRLLFRRRRLLEVTHKSNKPTTWRIFNVMAQAFIFLTKWNWRKSGMNKKRKRRKGAPQVLFKWVPIKSKRLP